MLLGIGGDHVADILTEARIKTLLAEPKPLDPGYARRLQLRSKRGHSEAELAVMGEGGSRFLVIVRRSDINVLDFSVILAHELPKSNRTFRMRRYNGKSHEHTNPLESETFYDYHIHEATERYQQSGNREDTFASPTSRYATVDGALQCLWVDASFQFPDGDAPLLFGGT